jgi:hypothetical protein
MERRMSRALGMPGPNVGRRRGVQWMMHFERAPQACERGLAELAETSATTIVHLKSVRDAKMRSSVRVAIIVLDLH